MPEHQLPDVVEPYDVARRPVPHGGERGPHGGERGPHGGERGLPGGERGLPGVGRGAWLPHGGERGPRLLAAKLTAPPSLGPLVDRPRLLRSLDDGVAGPVTLLSAPAGWGKTTLLGAWYRARAASGPPGWLSVEPDDTGGRLRAYLRAALFPTAGESDRGPDTEPDPTSHLGPDLGPDLEPDLGRDLGPDREREFLDRLADGLARQAEPLVMLLDDLHRAPDRGLADALDYLLRHAGDRLRLVIGSRTDPPLALHRWRLSGELTEIRAADLAFTAEETAELLAGHGVALPADRVGELTARTEGWPAGVRLAALSLRDQPDPVRFVDEFAGDHPDVADYLTEEVLAALPDDAREALCRASIVDRISGGLVDALTGRTDGEHLLAEVDRTTGFLTPVASRPPAYRCHRLLGELLRAELHRRPAAELGDLHRRVADWAAADGRPADALRHALAAGDWTRATALLTGHWPELVAPGPEPRATAVPPVPAPEVVRADPELALACATDRLRVSDLASADELLAIADRHEHLLPGGRRRRFRLISAALRLAMAERAGDPRDTTARARRLLDGGMDGAGGDGSARALAYAALGSARLEVGDLFDAERELTRGLAEAERSGPAAAALACAGRLALVRAVRGGLAEAERTARTALALPPCRDPFLPVDCAPAYLALAMVAVERDRPSEAEPQLSLVTGSAEAGPMVAALAGAVRARLLADRGELAGAHQAVLAARRHLTDHRAGHLTGHLTDHRAGHLTDHRADRAGSGTRAGQPDPRTPDDRPGSHLLTNWLLAMEADLHTAHGDLDSARRVLLPALEREVDSTEPLAVACARAYLRAGDPAAAARTLPDWDASGGRWLLAVRLEAGLLDALIARVAGDHRRAARTLERVLRLAEPDGFRRVFTRSDPPARDLLAAHLDSGTAYWPMLSDLLSASEPPPPVSTGAGRGEPLTDRELTVLRYLQSILSNVEIASEMSLSVNTVKTHVRNIYRKLDASRRREAVRRARELRLI